MIKLIKQWAVRDAKWWQFWLPQSGTPGGIIVAIAVILAWACVRFGGGA